LFALERREENITAQIWEKESRHRTGMIQEFKSEAGEK
jgi:hypothetical protein